MPTRSMTRADSIISSSGSIVSCITPIRKGGGTDGSFQDLTQRPTQPLLLSDGDLRVGSGPACRAGTTARARCRAAGPDALGLRLRRDPLGGSPLLARI